MHADSHGFTRIGMEPPGIASVAQTVMQARVRDCAAIVMAWGTTEHSEAKVAKASQDPRAFRAASSIIAAIASWLKGTPRGAAKRRLASNGLRWRAISGIWNGGGAGQDGEMGCAAWASWHRLFLRGRIGRNCHISVEPAQWSPSRSPMSEPASAIWDPCRVMSLQLTLFPSWRPKCRNRLG